jgi:hypothetical protein
VNVLERLRKTPEKLFFFGVMIAFKTSGDVFAISRNSPAAVAGLHPPAAVAFLGALGSTSGPKI